MKYALLLFVSLSMQFNVLAQDTLLPTEKFTIYLASGNLINNISLVKIDSLHVQYLENNDLSNKPIKEVYFIESLNYRIEFDKDLIIKIRKYDLIVLTNGDTVRGFIKDLTYKNISYMTNGISRKKIHSYQSYILNTRDIELQNKLNSDRSRSKKITKEDIKYFCAGVGVSIAGLLFFLKVLNSIE